MHASCRRNVRSLPWVRRTELLREAFPAGDRLRLIQTQAASRTVQDQLVALGFEGSVLKRAGSAYRPDRPKRGWDDQWNDDHGQPRDRATD